MNHPAPSKTAIVFVPYRPIWYYERLGPCVRDWAMMEVAFHIADEMGVPFHIIDRPSFPPWRKAGAGDAPLRRIADSLPEDRITRSARVPLMATLLRSRKASAPIITRALDPICKRHDRVLLVDFDPFGPITTPANARHWFDEIDDFSKHRRMPMRDRKAFLAKRAQTHDIHTASSLETTVGEALPNWVFTPITPTPDIRPDYAFGYIGYVDNKMDLDLVARLAAVGRYGIWGKILDREVHRKLSEIPGVDLMGEYDAKDLQGIMERFQTGTIPFLLDRIHGNSPIKYYQYSAAHKTCLSTSSFGLERDNLVICDGNGPEPALSRLPDPSALDWAEIERQNNEGRTLFEDRFRAELEAMR